jgi:pimeloyl-ACP methyl ester carboxylesterase
VFGFQTHLIFPTHAVASPGPLPRGAEKLTVETPDGERLAGVHIPADEPSRERTMILAFGGNAWNAQDVAEYLHELFPQQEIVAFHYRGYKPSTGSPSAEALMADAPLVYDVAMKRLRPDRIVAVGFSIGSGIAAQLSAVRALDGVILVTPFDSLKSVAQAMYPWLPIGPFFEHEIDAASASEKSRVPTAIIGAEHDEIVPSGRTEALKSRVPNLVFERTIGRAGHNDIYARSEFHEAMREALHAIAR